MSFEVAPLADLPDVLRIQPSVFSDERGEFLETWRAGSFAEVGITDEFVQDNLSVSHKGVLRGLHYQLPPFAQSKLVSVSLGRIFDVVVDLRRSSSTFGTWSSVELSSDDRNMLWVPAGFAHGFLALSEPAVVAYRVSAVYSPDAERSLRWDDPAIGIEWPLDEEQPRVSAKDETATALEGADVFT